jgi:thiol-disulfide isomerase/thioredoxin
LVASSAVFVSSATAQRSAEPQAGAPTTEFLSDVLRDWRQAKKAGVPDTSVRVALAARAFRVADQAFGRERYESLRFIAGLDGARPSLELMLARDRALERMIAEYAGDGDVMGEFVLRVLRDDEHDRQLRALILRTTQLDAVRAACAFRPVEALLERAMEGDMIAVEERDLLLAVLTQIAAENGAAKHPLSAKTWREFALGFAEQVRGLLLLGEVVPELYDARESTPQPRLLALRGKVLLVHFWGEWAEACRPLHARLRALGDRRATQRFELVGVNSDPLRATLESALLRDSLDWPNLWDGAAGTSGRNALRWRVRGWPTWYLIDAQGVLRRRWLGAPTPEDFEQALGLLR